MFNCDSKEVLVQNHKCRCLFITTNVCFEAEASITLVALLTIAEQSVLKNRQVLSVGKNIQAHRE